MARYTRASPPKDRRAKYRMSLRSAWLDEFILYHYGSYEVWSRLPVGTVIQCLADWDYFNCPVGKLLP